MMDPSTSEEDGHSRKKVKLNSSHVHEYFEITERLNPRTDKFEAASKCITCGHIFSGKNATNLKAHLEKKHREKFLRVKSLDDESRERAQETRKPPETGTLADTLLTPPRGQQEGSSRVPTLKRRNSTENWTEDNQDRSNKMLAIWIGGSVLPVSCVEDKNMENYVKSLNPQASVPSRGTLQNDIEKIADKVVLKIKECLLTSRQVAITTDIWSSMVSTDAFLGVTAHFINTDTRKRQSLKIACEKFNDCHSGSNIAEKLLSILQRYGIEDKTKYVLTDSGSNMIKAWMYTLPEIS